MLLYVQTWLPLLTVTLTADDGARKDLTTPSQHAPAVVRGGHGTKRACIRCRSDEWNRSQSGSSYHRPPGVKPGRPLNYALPST